MKAKSNRFTICCGKCRQSLMKVSVGGTWRLICPEAIGSGDTEHSVYLTYMPDWVLTPNWDGHIASTGLLATNLQGLPLIIMENVELCGKVLEQERRIVYEGAWPSK